MILIRSVRGPGGVVGTATGYGSDGPGIESRPEARFSAPVQTRPCGPLSLLYNGHRVFPGGKERPGLNAEPSPPIYCHGHERVELYLYSPYGPYGLYKASVLVQRGTLPLPLPSKFTFYSLCPQAINYVNRFSVYLIINKRLFLSKYVLTL